MAAVIYRTVSLGRTRPAAQCRAWNEQVPLGGRVIVTLPSGVERVTQTRTPALLLGGVTPVVYVIGWTGACPLERVRPEGSSV